MNKVLYGDCLNVLKKLQDNSVDMCVTSPPYFGLRDYGSEHQIGLNQTPSSYIDSLASVFMEVHRVLKDHGTLWINIGDTYSGAGKRTLQDRKRLKMNTMQVKKVFDVKPKNLLGIPWRLAFALQDRGWYLRQDIIWNKPNAMPEAVKDRCSNSHEYLFLLSKSSKYYFDHEDIKEYDASALKGQLRVNKLYANDTTGLRNRRSVWSIQTQPYNGAHTAPYPEELVRLCILAGTQKGDTVLDPFLGSGTTAATAVKCGRKYIGIELNKSFSAQIDKRIKEAEDFAARLNKKKIFKS